jgi:hypothetical protein
MPEDRARSYRRAFWTAVAITVAAWLLPFGGLAIYPLSLLATWAHEMGHGLTALLAGGHFQKLQIFPGLSGLAHTATSGAGAAAVVAAGGLLGAPILGAATIAAGVRPGWSRGLLIGLGVALIASVAIWVRNPFGVVSVALLGAGTLYCGLRLSANRRFIAVQLVGVQLTLSALRNWGYLFVGEARIGGELIPSDTAAVARAIGGTYWIWGIAILALEVALLFGSYRLVRYQLRRSEGSPLPRRTTAR